MTELELARHIIRRDPFFKTGYLTDKKVIIYEELLTGASAESIMFEYNMPKSTVRSHITKFNRYMGEHRVRNSISKLKGRYAT